MQQETIRRLVKASGVHAGEQVLIHLWGEDETRPVANGFMEAVAALGAMPMLLQQARTVNRALFTAAQEGSFDQRYFDRLSGFDAVLDLFAYQPVTPGGPLAPEVLERYRRYMARLFDALMRAGRFTQIRLPTAANAAESGLVPEEFIRRMEAAYDIDYEALAAACGRELTRFAGASSVEVHTGNGCVLRLELQGRPWHTDAGDGDLPCGEVYVAPLEEGSRGSVFFEALWLDGRCYGSATLQIEGGQVVDCSQPEAAAYFARLPREERVLCELGIGLNPRVTELCGYTVLDEKLAGSFHIALGANHMFGGRNRAGDHRDLVGRGRIEVCS